MDGMGNSSPAVHGWGHGRSTPQVGRSTQEVKPSNIPSGTMVFNNPLIKALILGDGGIGTLRFP